MHLEITKKINLKKFILLSLVPTIICFMLARNNHEIFAISIVYIATIIYLLMFAEAIYLLTNQYKPGYGEASKVTLGFLFIGKLVILISSLLFGVQIMENRIIIPVINYVIIIFVLGASTNKTN